MANYSKGKIAIPRVTGNIVINIEAVQSAPPYTNLVPTSTDENGAVFNSTGYQNGKRIPSSGSISDQAGSTITGFIPFAIGDVLRIGGVLWNKDDTTIHTSIMAYDSSHAILESVSGRILNTYGKLIKENGVYKYTLGDSTEIIAGSGNFTKITSPSVAYIRVSAAGDGANLIITKNQEITA